MHGFFGSYKAKVTWDLSSFDDKSFVKRTHSEGDFHLTQVTLPKFLNDKYFAEIDDCFLATEGVLFEADKPEEAIAQYRNGETTFWNSWRGSFAGVLYDSKTDTLLVFNDHIGSKMLFWYQKDKEFYLSSDLFELAHTAGLSRMSTSFMHRILAFGYSNNDATIVEGIHRLGAGQMLTCQNGNVEVKQYYSFDNTPTHFNEQETLDETDRCFRQAIKRIIDKNEEYGLKQFYPLSGGLDSRMVQIVMRQLTSRPITNFTYSQTGHYDHLLPEKIADFLGNEWLFLPLDGGNYLTQIDAITQATQGLVNYNGPSEIYYCSTQFDWRDVGVVATGVNGDNIFSVETDYVHEIGRLYSLSFAGNGLGSPLVLQQHTETYSPFCDVDVLNYVLHIPLSKRWNYHFYDKWILRYYPDATQWDHKGEQIGHRRIVLPIMGRNIPLLDIPKRITFAILKRLHIYNGYQMEMGVSMNPYDSWMRSNPNLRKALYSYYEKNKHLLTPYPSIQEKARIIMREGRVYDQCAVLTILSAIRQII